MPALCNSVPSQGSFAPGMLSYFDCQAQSLGMQGYQAMAAPGSTASILLTGMVTLLIALIGYRMLLGDVPTMRDGVLTVLRIGLVLALATGWPAYQTLVFDLVLREPAELAASVGGAAGLPGMTDGLAARLDGIDQALSSLAISGTGTLDVQPGAMATANIAPPPFLGFDGWALGWSRVGFLVGAVGAFAALRMLAGILLALGPLFLLFLLFDGTRGLVAGWIRALLFCMIGSTATALVLGIELGLLEPWLGNLLARRASGLDIVGAPAQLFATSLIFSFGLLAVLGGVAMVGAGFRLPRWNGRGGSDPSLAWRPAAAATGGSGTPSIPHDSRSRAAAIADAVAVMQRREAPAAAVQAATISAIAGRGAPAADSAIGTSGRASPSSARRANRRVSARARARDRMI